MGKKGKQGKKGKRKKRTKSKNASTRGCPNCNEQNPLQSLDCKSCGQFMKENEPATQAATSTTQQNMKKSTKRRNFYSVTIFTN